MACNAASSPPDIVARDSGGVHIVEMRTSPWTTSEAWTVRPDPTFDIGGVNGPLEYQFDRIVGVARLGDGSVVVANAGSGQICVFDSIGKFVSATGQLGGGPGEYRQIASMGVGSGDSLWVYDFGARRFTVLDKHGRFVRTMSPGGELSNIGAVGRAEDGSFVVREYWSSRAQSGEPASGLARTWAAVARVAPNGQLADTVGLFLGREVFLGTYGGRRMMSAPPFARATNIALRATDVIVGEQSSFEFAAYAITGELRSVIRASNVELRVSESDVEAYIAQQVSQLPAADRPRRRRDLASLGVPATRPAYSDLKVDRDGNLWVAEYVFPGLIPRRWVVFGVDGMLAGIVILPERFVVYDIGRDSVVGVWRDAVDVEHVRVYEFERPGT